MKTKRPDFVKRQNKIWVYGRNNRDRGGAHVRKDRFKFYKEELKKKATVPLEMRFINEIKKWD